MRKSFSQKVAELKNEAENQYHRNSKAFQVTNNWDRLHIANQYLILKGELQYILNKLERIKKEETIFENEF